MREDLTLERLQVREAIERYFFAVDAKDFSALATCFCDDAKADYHATTPELNTVSGGMAISQSVFSVCSQFTASTHSVCNFIAEIRGDPADTNTFAIAHVVFGTRVLVRGIRYQDKLKKAKQWQIVHRIHTPL